MTKPRRRASSKVIRRRCFEYWKQTDETTGEFYMVCHLSGQRIYPAHGDLWHAEHNVAWANGGDDSPPNVCPALVAPHKVKTRRDSKEMARGRRSYERHHGIRISTRPISGSRNTRWARRWNKHTGRWETVRRDPEGQGT